LAQLVYLGVSIYTCTLFKP